MPFVSPCSSREGGEKSGRRDSGERTSERASASARAHDLKKNNYRRVITGKISTFQDFKVVAISVSSVAASCRTWLIRISYHGCTMLDERQL